MVTNRSVPDASVIPVLAYDDVAVAVAWLSRAFGFRERLRIADHRAQLTYAGGALIVTQRSSPRGASSAQPESAAEPEAVLVRVPDVDRHHEHAVASGARIVMPPTDQVYGERQYVAEDIGGHRWTFSESISDVDPATWGAVVAGIESDPARPSR